jgi:hypothetical protein
MSADPYLDKNGQAALAVTFLELKKARCIS